MAVRGGIGIGDSHHGMPRFSGGHGAIPPILRRFSARRFQEFGILFVGDRRAGDRYVPGGSDHRQILFLPVAGAGLEARIGEAAQALFDAFLPVLKHLIDNLLHFLNLGRMFGGPLQFFKFRFLALDDFVVIGSHLLFQCGQVRLGGMAAPGGDQSFRFLIQLRAFFLDGGAVFVQFGLSGGSRESHADGCGHAYRKDALSEIDVHNCFPPVGCRRCKSAGALPLHL